jgi:hypothetical protein
LLDTQISLRVSTPGTALVFPETFDLDLASYSCNQAS